MLEKGGNYLKNLKEEIAENLKKLEAMIKLGKDKNEIEGQRKELDNLLEKYLKDI